MVLLNENRKTSLKTNLKMLLQIVLVKKDSQTHETSDGNKFLT